MRKLKRLLLLGLCSATASAALVAADGVITRADALRMRAAPFYDEAGEVRGWYCWGKCDKGASLCCDIGPA